MAADDDELARPQPNPARESARLARTGDRRRTPLDVACGLGTQCAHTVGVTLIERRSNPAMSAGGLVCCHAGGPLLFARVCISVRRPIEPALPIPYDELLFSVFASATRGEVAALGIPVNYFGCPRRSAGRLQPGGPLGATLLGCDELKGSVCHVILDDLCRCLTSWSSSDQALLQWISAAQQRCPAVRCHVLGADRNDPPKIRSGYRDGARISCERRTSQAYDSSFLSPFWCNDKRRLDPYSGVRVGQAALPRTTEINASER